MATVTATLLNGTATSSKGLFDGVSSWVWPTTAADRRAAYKTIRDTIKKIPLGSIITSVELRFSAKTTAMVDGSELEAGVNFGGDFLKMFSTKSSIGGTIADKIAGIMIGALTVIRGDSHWDAKSYAISKTQPTSNYLSQTFSTFDGDIHYGGALIKDPTCSNTLGEFQFQFSDDSMRQDFSIGHVSVVWTYDEYPGDANTFIRTYTDGGGSITSSKQVVGFGETFMLQATPYTDYFFDCFEVVMGDYRREILHNNPTTIPNYSFPWEGIGVIEATAYFYHKDDIKTKVSYSYNSSQGNVSGVTRVANLDSVSVKITPKTGYQIKQVTVTPTNLIDDLSINYQEGFLTFINLSSSHTDTINIKIDFEKIPFKFFTKDKYSTNNSVKGTAYVMQKGTTEYLTPFKIIFKEGG